MNSGSASSDLLYFTEQGAGPPLLLIHGLMVSGAMFDPVLRSFAGRHRVIAPDLRGHGRSRSLPGPFTAVRLAADLARLLDHLGIAATAVFGYSQGGAIAQQFALDYPGRCSRLILGCTYAFNMASLREKLEGRLAPLLVRALGMRGFARLAVRMGAPEMGRPRGEWLANLMAEQDRDLMLAAWKQAMAFDSRRRLGEIRCPALIVAGSRDAAVPLHHARMLHEGISESRLHVVEGATHSLLWTHPDEVVRLTEEFLADPPP
jgi:pimeloyl-ACP methyl ester carboxylesterase